MDSVAAALARIKDDPDAVLSRQTIDDACRAHVPGGGWRATPLAPRKALARCWGHSPPPSVASGAKPRRIVFSVIVRGHMNCWR